MLYGIQYGTVLHSIKESVYFHRMSDATKVCDYLNNLPENRKLDKFYIPFSTTLQFLERFGEFINIKNTNAQSMLKHQLCIKDYKVYESAVEFLSSIQSSSIELSADLLERSR